MVIERIIVKKNWRLKSLPLCMNYTMNHKGINREKPDGCTLIEEMQTKQMKLGWSNKFRGLKATFLL